MESLQHQHDKSHIRSLSNPDDRPKHVKCATDSYKNVKICIRAVQLHNKKNQQLKIINFQLKKKKNLDVFLSDIGLKGKTFENQM